MENVKKELESGKDPQTIIDEDLIPAVNKVGELFEQKKYFLPQLIAGATAMDLAIEYITPLLHIEENAKPKVQSLWRRSRVISTISVKTLLS